MSNDTDDNKRLRTEDAARFLSELLGIRIEPKTIANWRVQRRGPVPEYFGLRPVYRIGELRRFVAEEALTARPPRRRGRPRRVRLEPVP